MAIIELYKKINLDLDTERNRINEPRVYNAKERKRLLGLVDLVESGNLGKALSYFVEMTRDEREYVGIELSNFLEEAVWDSAVRLKGDEPVITNLFKLEDGNLVPAVKRDPEAAVKSKKKVRE